MRSLTMALSLPATRWKTPRDTQRLNAAALGSLVAALGGGAMAAWVIRVGASVGAFRIHPVPGPWLELVMFGCTAWLTSRAVRRCLDKGSLFMAPWICSFYGALNAMLCWWLIVPTVARGAEEAFAMALLGAIPAAMVGWGFGLAFGLGYLPILALAQRGAEEPSHDVLTRMVPWATAWLTLTALVVGFARPRQELLAFACTASSFGLALFAVRADGRREAFIEGLADGALPHLRLSRAHDTAAALPLVGGSAAGAALVEAQTLGAGPFRAAAAEQTHATVSAEAKDERFRLMVRTLFCRAMLVTNSAMFGGLLALVVLT